MTDNPGYRLIVTGHSLGAGTAGMLALLWYGDPEINRLPLTVYPLAPPLIFSETFNPFIDQFVTSVVCGSDLVCRLSFGTVKDLVNVVKFFVLHETSDSPNKSGAILR
jgi:hypothetical protein